MFPLALRASAALLSLLTKKSQDSRSKYAVQHQSPRVHKACHKVSTSHMRVSTSWRKNSPHLLIVPQAPLGGRLELRVGTFPAAPAESAHKSTRDLGVVGCSRRSSGGRIRVEHLLLSPTCHQPLSRSSSSPPPSPSPNPLASSPDVFAHHASQGTCSFKYNLEPQVACSTIKTRPLSEHWPGLLRTRDWLYTGGGSDSEVDNRRSTNTQGQNSNTWGQNPHLAILIQCLGRYCREHDSLQGKIKSGHNVHALVLHQEIWAVNVVETSSHPTPLLQQASCYETRRGYNILKIFHHLPHRPHITQTSFLSLLWKYFTCGVCG